MRITVAKRLVFLSSVGVAVAVATGVVGVMGLRNVGTALQKSVATAAVLRTQMDADMMHDALRADALNALQSRTPEQLRDASKDCAEHVERFRSNIEANLKAELEPAVRSRLEGMRPTLDNYLHSAEALVGTAAKGESEAAAGMFPAFQETFSALEKEMEEAGDLIQKASEESARQAEQAVQSRMNFSIGTIGVGIVALLGLAVYISRSIVGPLRACRSALSRVASGDLTVSTAIRSEDEIGDLARDCDAMTARLRELVGTVARNADALASVTSELKSRSVASAQGLGEQQKQAEQVSAAVEETSASATDVASKAAGAAEAAKASQQAASHGGSEVEATVSEMKAIANTVHESATAVGALGKKSEQIGRIIGVINDIADQTNLLALNAAIEAARAGEHGRGFAVVADEVRKLAERTTQATEEVAKSVREIQTDTSKAVEMFSTGTQRVSAGVERASAAGKTLVEIVDNSRTLQGMVEAIAAAAAEQSTASEQIARSVERISAVTRESAQGAQEAAGSAERLGAQAQELQKAVAKFKV